LKIVHLITDLDVSVSSPGEVEQLAL